MSFFALVLGRAGYIKEIKVLLRDLGIIEFSENNYELTLNIQKKLVLIGDNLESIRENDPFFFERYDNIPWDTLSE